jgi:DNA-binding XRE family transcriptional regulator
VRDQAVRVELGIPLKTAARLVGVSHPTLRLYEVDASAVKTTEKRAACALFYSELRRLMARAPLTREIAEDEEE